MRLDLMPTNPRSREEAAGYLRAFSGILLIFAVVQAVINLVFSLPPSWWLEFAINIPLILLAAIFYQNARTDYKWWGPNAQLVVIITLIGAVLTLMMHLYGSTSAPHPALFTVVIFISTVYVSTKAGAFTFFISTTMYLGIIILEEKGLIGYARYFPEKQSIADIEHYARGMFVLVFAINTVTYASAMYIARALAKRREDAERAKDVAENALGELEVANQKLVEMDNAKTRFLSIVSHDLRTPITSIKAFGEIIAEESDGETRKKAD